MKVVAGIVTYHPNRQRLIENIMSLHCQVDHVLIIDNGSEELEFIKDIACTNVSVVRNGENLGMAKALNILLNFALENKYEWMITMDQDSILLEGIVERYLSYSHLNDVAAMTCFIQDRNLQEQLDIINIDFKYVKECITSGCFCNVKILEKIGGFDEALFIDLVDTEFCFNLYSNGYKIIRIPQIGLLHEMGHAESFSVGNKKVTVYSEPPLRHYYISRNWVYVYKKYRRKEYLFRMVYSGLKTIVFEKQRLKKIKAICLGIYDGIKNNMDVCSRRI